MKIAITGAKGMLANELIPLLNKHQLVLLDLPEIDITQINQVAAVLKDVSFVYHFAAFTDVDGAETQQQKAYAVNELGTINVAKTCAAANIPLLYISTDYVFGNSEKNSPWLEDAQPNPQGIYAKSKLAGELAVQKYCQKYFIVRTAWLYGPKGKNFVDTIIKYAKERPELKVVNDQKGSPTFTRHLAQALIKYLDIKEYGVYHLTNQGEVTWYEFAQEILQQAGLATRIIPCTTQEFPRPAPRPKYSVLANKHWQDIGQKLLPAWQDGLKEYLKEKVKV